MLALYLFCAALGIPLLALFAFGGGDGDAEVGGGFDADADVGADFDMDLDVGDADIGGIGDFTGLIRKIPVSSYTFFLSFFGGIGTIGTWLDFGFATTLIMAVVLGILAASINTALFSFLRRTDSSSHFTDAQLEGRLATVSIPFEGVKRGRVWIDTGDERVQLTAGAVEHDLDEAFSPGDRVVIVDVTAGVAKVMRADPDLSA